MRPPRLKGFLKTRGRLQMASGPDSVSPDPSPAKQPGFVTPGAFAALTQCPLPPILVQVPCSLNLREQHTFWGSAPRGSAPGSRA